MRFDDITVLCSCCGLAGPAGSGILVNLAETLLFAHVGNHSLAGVGLIDVVGFGGDRLACQVLNFKRAFVEDDLEMDRVGGICRSSDALNLDKVAVLEGDSLIVKTFVMVFVAACQSESKHGGKCNCKKFYFFHCCENLMILGAKVQRIIDI